MGVELRCGHHSGGLSFSGFKSFSRSETGTPLHWISIMHYIYLTDL